ncbi:MAG: oxidoreductase, partial [Betaproteobacteria bacterium]|nr:oxidoreductase [Betaproteobacteria bacterium]
MTAPSEFFSGFSLLLLAGALLLLYGTGRAVKERGNYRSLILWGAAADGGLIVMGLGGGTSGMLGALLFALFQLAARGLAFTALHALSEDGVSPTAVSLRGIASRKPLTAWIFGLGLLAALGASPFLVPEGRVFLIQAIVQISLWPALLAAFCSTVFIWLSVEAVQRVCLEHPPLHHPELPGVSRAIASVARAPASVMLPALAVAALGLWRSPLTEALGNLFGLKQLHGEFWHPVALVLYAGAFVTAAAGLFNARLREWCSVACMAGAFGMALHSPLAPLPHLFVLLITGIGFVVTLYSVGYMAHSHRLAAYYFFLPLTFASLTGIVTSTDMGAFYGYWELMTFASYFLVAHDGDHRSCNAALKYYVMCAGGAFLMLPGLMLVGGGATAMSAVAAASAKLPPQTLQCAVALGLAGFAVKAGLVPLHSWLPDAHPAAPSSVSGPLSGLITKMGIFGMVLFISLMGPAALRLAGPAGFTWMGYCVTLMGGLTLVYGELMALRQEDVKRMLAYSTLGQLGEITLVLGLGSYLATVGALAHVINHAIMKDLLFLGAGALILRVGSRKLADLAGIGREMPWTVSCMAVGLIAIMGLPPFGGFMSKYLMIQACVSSGHAEMAALILLGSMVGLIYYTRILRVLVFEERPAGAAKVEEAPLTIRLALTLLAGCAVIPGLAPQLLVTLVEPVASATFIVPPEAEGIFRSITVSWPGFVLLPFAGALLPILLHKRPAAAGWSTVAVLLATALYVGLAGRNLDTLSYAFALIVPLVGALNMAYAVGYLAHSHQQWRFYSAFCCMCAGLVGIASSQYLFSFFLFWEIMSSWALYLAIAHESTREALHEAFKYFFFNVFGAGFIFVGMAVLGPACPLSAKVAALSLGGSMGSLAVAGAVALLAVGFVMKAAQLPFRIDWQMHPALAPTPVSGYISSVLLKSAILGLVKLFLLLSGPLMAGFALDMVSQTAIQYVVMWIGGITIIMAAVQALLQTDLKLVFIYSTVSQIGYMVLAVATGSSLGLAGGLLHVANHVFFKDLLFLVCGAVMLQTGSHTLDFLGGIGRKMPLTLLAFAVGGLSVVGVPPSNGFTSKWIIYHALMEAGEPFLALLSLVGSVITLAYIAKFLHAAFLGQPSQNLDQVHEAPKVMLIPMMILSAGTVITGVFPGLLLGPINEILAEYNIPRLHVALTGIISGAGAWNAATVALMVFVAFSGAWFTLLRLVRANERTTDVHTCGIPPEKATSRMNPASIFGSLTGG